MELDITTCGGSLDSVSVGLMESQTWETSPPSNVFPDFADSFSSVPALFRDLRCDEEHHVSLLFSLPVGCWFMDAKSLDPAQIKVCRKFLLVLKDADQVKTPPSR